MKILLVNQVFYPDVVATAQYLTDLALELKRAGHEVTVLAGRRGYADPHPKYPKTEIWQGIKIIRVWPFAFSRKSKFLRILDAGLMNIAFLIKLLFAGRYDRVIALTSPPLVALAASFYAGIYKSKLICWVMDLNPDEAVAAGWIKQGGRMERILNWIAKNIFIKSHKVVVLDRFMKEKIVKKGVPEEKVTVIPPWAHTEELQSVPHEANPFRKEWGLNGRFVVMYAGNHSLCHPLDTLLDAAVLLKDEPSILFLFAGGGERVKDVLRYKTEHRLDNVVYKPYVERSRLKYSLSAGDLHVVTMGEGYVGVVHPCKIYDILFLAKPFIFIGPQTSHVGDLLKDTEGIHVNHGEVEKLASIIRQAGEGGISGPVGPSLVHQFSRENLSSTLIKVILQN